MHLIRTLSPVVASILVALGSPTFAQTAKTDPVGFTTLDVQVGTSLVVPTLNNSSVFIGMAAISLDGLTITPTNSPSWVSGAYASTSFTPPAPNYPTHYAEIISGPQEGLVIDVSNNSPTALIVGSGEITAASGLRGTTVQVALRRHMTLDKVIVGATGLSAGEDAVSVFNSNGSQSVRYYNGTSFVDENFQYAAGHTVVYPGTGFVITVANPVKLTFLGDVKTTKTQINMFAGATNIVGPLNPSSSTLFYGNTSLAAALAPGEDGINNFSVNGQMTTVGAYASNGTQILDGNFAPLLPSATDAIPLNRGIVVSVVADTVWTAPAPPIAP